MICKRCGSDVRNSHNTINCTTFEGYVWCPTHNDRFPQLKPCSHYLEYRYEKGMAEGFFIGLILSGYHDGDWRSRRNKSKMKKQERVQKKHNSGGLSKFF